MSTNQTAKNPIVIPLEKQAALKALTTAPTIAWPTVGLLLWIVFGVLSVDLMVLNGYLPLWSAIILNPIFMYPVFHVAHDALHRAAASNHRLNDWFGQLALLFVIPEVSLGVFRYAHMIHHRLTNTENDPDHYVFGSNWFTTVLRWMTFEFYYAYYCYKDNKPASRKALKEVFKVQLILVPVLTVLIVQGYGMEVLMLWFIPSRITIAAIGCVFLWLPHLSEVEEGGLSSLKKAGPSEENLTAGTTVRLGKEPVLNVLMQWHNYHLIHHLWPTTPSYNHVKVLKLLEPELRDRDLHIQHDFNLNPVFYPGGSTV